MPRVDVTVMAMVTVTLTLALALVVPSAARADGVFGVGAGFGPDEGFIADASIAQDDLFHTGQKLALTARISKLHERFALEHVLPFGDGLELTSTLFDDRRALPGFTREAIGGTATLGARIDRTTRVYIRYRLEQIATGDPVDLIARRTSPATERGDGLMSALGVGVLHDTTDGPIPLHGTRVELFGEAADRRLGSDHDVTTLTARIDHAHPLGPLTLRVSGRAGYVTSRDPGGVPMSERLYHDGNADLRGYALGGLDVGANFEALGRVELEAPLILRGSAPVLSLAGFFDAGVTYNADRAWGGGQGKEIRRAVGASLIWRSPIGPLRFDVALPLDGTDHDKRFLFTLGLGF